MSNLQGRAKKWTRGILTFCVPCDDRGSTFKAIKAGKENEIAKKKKKKQEH